VKAGEVQEFVVARHNLRFFSKATGMRAAPSPI
jgi:hypothetical protein